jgi:PAS domain S-box-containing protein
MNSPPLSQRILVVEDSDVQALALCGVLEAGGFVVGRAVSAEDALDRLSRETPDLVIADVNLPGMDGRELTRQLRANADTRAIPVLMMTAPGAADGERSGIESGADAYLEKTRDSQTILMRVNALLRTAKPDRSGAGARIRRGCIVVLDSSETSGGYFVELLERGGVQVDLVKSITDLRARASRAPEIDCVAVNLNDAGFPGVETCGQLAAFRDDVASETGDPGFLVVGLSRVEDGELEKAAFMAGADDVISTVSDGEALRLRMRALLRRRSIQRDARREAVERATARTAAEQFRLLVEGVVDYAICLLDAEGRVSTWNPGAERIKGYTADEIVGHHFSKFYTPEDIEAGRPAYSLDMARRHGRFETEAVRVRKDGTRFFAHVTIDAIQDAEGEVVGFAKITRDITEKRKAEEELQLAREALAQAQKMEAIGQLTGGIAHDFNNMLAGIIGGLNLAQRRIDAGRYSEVGRFIDAATTSAQRAAALTTRLLAFGRRQTLDLRPVDVSATIASMRVLLERSLGGRIQIETRLPEQGLWARTDESQLESAVLNLAINARDAMPDGGRLTIRVSEEDVGEDVKANAGDAARVRVDVMDTGAGIPPEVLERVFEPFFTTKPIGQGTGLGLSMVYGFASQSGGSVSIASEPGHGTVVSLFLPSSEPAVETPERPPALESLKAASGERILVVEDDPQVRMVIMEALDELGYRAQAVGDATRALEIIEGQSPIDLLISDVGLPGMDGRQLAERARRQRPDLRVLFITAYAQNAAVRSEFLSEGMDMIFKPFAVEDVAAKVREIIRTPVGADGV